MGFITGFDWMLSCTTEFDATVSFLRDVLGLEIVDQGTPQIDHQFSRYARAVLPNGPSVEVVEPGPSARDVRGRQILCLTVDDIVEATRELRARGAVFASGLIDDGQGLGWVYIRAPDGNVYQVYGPIRSTAPGDCA